MDLSDVGWIEQVVGYVEVVVVECYGFVVIDVLCWVVEIFYFENVFWVGFFCFVYLYLEQVVVFVNGVGVYFGDMGNMFCIWNVGVGV